jgi:hypothetical protein
MNLKKQAEKLETFLEEEFRKNIPVLVLPDKSIVYKNYKIKKTKQGDWSLKSMTNDQIKIFRIKATALLAAKFYDQNRFARYNEVCSLDTRYWSSAVDASFFRYRYEHSKDLDKRDLYLWRWEISNNRAKAFKEEISRMFKNNF